MISNTHYGNTQIRTLIVSDSVNCEGFVSFCDVRINLILTKLSIYVA